MITNIRKVTSMPRYSSNLLEKSERLAFDVVCDECGEFPIIEHQHGKALCSKHVSFPLVWRSKGTVDKGSEVINQFERGLEKGIEVVEIPVSYPKP